MVRWLTAVPSQVWGYDKGWQKNTARTANLPMAVLLGGTDLHVALASQGPATASGMAGYGGSFASTPQHMEGHNRTLLSLAIGKRRDHHEPVSYHAHALVSLNYTVLRKLR